MLDQLADTDTDKDSGPRPKSTAPSGDVEGSVRHLGPQDLEAYSSGRLTSARLDYCRTHLDSCEDCRSELEDLRIFKSELSGFPRAEPNRRELGRPKRRGGLRVTQVVSVATVVVAAGSTLLLWKHGSPWSRHESPRPTTTAAAVSTAQSSGASATPGTPAALAASATPTAVATSAALATPGARATPTAVATPGAATTAAALAARPIAGLPHDAKSAAAPEANTGFALLGPFGEAISDTRPEFRWQPLPGAIGYSVAIVDTGLHPVQHSPALRATVWRPRRPLRPGHTYLWEVTATMPGGAKVVASQPSPSEAAILRIIPPKLADEIQHFRQGHHEAHLVLGALYAQAGMLTESADELRKVPPGDPGYNAARTLLAGLESTKPSDAPP
ncbi:MAG: hypothetical protein JO042_02600 [Sinobacteraceae bacterium]|nr:hypothetical protein [Nevskiaceae bacterium]